MSPTDPGECIVCRRPASSDLCPSCCHSYDRSAIPDGGSVMDIVQWAAERAVRLRASTRKRGRGVSIFFDSDDLVMLHDRVMSGWEQSEEGGWPELLHKVEAARQKLQDDTP